MIVSALLEQAARAVHALDASENLSGVDADAVLEAFNARLQQAVTRPLVARPLAADATLQTGYEYQVDATGGSYDLTMPEPREGKVVGVVDARDRFSTDGPALLSNGYKIEGSRNSLSLTEGGRWVFFSHAGDWWRIRDLTLADTFPLPPDLTGPFRDILAVELAALNNVPLPEALKLRLEGAAMAMKRFG